MDRVLTVGLTVAALSFAGSGAALVLMRRAMVSGVLLLTTGLLVVAGLVADAGGYAEASRAAFVTAGMLAAALALATYPVARRGPVDLAAYVVLVGLGLASLGGRVPTSSAPPASPARWP